MALHSLETLAQSAHHLAFGIYREPFRLEAVPRHKVLDTELFCRSRDLLLDLFLHNPEILFWKERDPHSKGALGGHGRLPLSSFDLSLSNMQTLMIRKIQKKNFIFGEQTRLKLMGCGNLSWGKEGCLCSGKFHSFSSFWRRW